MNIKLLLLNPPARERYVKESRCQHRAAVFQSVYPPLTLAYMASLTRDEHEVKLLDAIGDELSLKEVMKLTGRFKPDLVVVNTTTPTIENDLEVLEELKHITDAKIALFGVHATRFAKELLEYPQVDIVIKGEPELTVKDLCNNPVKDVKGILYRDGEEVKETPSREFLDPDRLPFPAWDLVNLDNYRMPVFNEKYVLLMTGRGCPYNCTFCVSPSYYGKKLRQRSVENIVREIYHVKSLGIENFFFFVETFTLDKEFVMDLCEEIIKRNLGIRWICNSRVDTVDKRMLELMKKAGCWLISYGIESASQKILDNVNKGITLEKSRDAVSQARNSGIAVIGHFIFGLPGETKATLKKTIDFAKSLPLNFAEFYIATPFPGSELFESLKSREYNAIDWSRFEYSHQILSKKLNLEETRERAYREFYLRPKVILRGMRLFGIRNLPRLAIGGIRFLSTI